jgi:hypothetical protein
MLLTYPISSGSLNLYADTFLKFFKLCTRTPDGIPYYLLNKEGLKLYDFIFKLIMKILSKYRSLLKNMIIEIN